jgi:A/G-specific adenine glycosylase
VSGPGPAVAHDRAPFGPGGDDGLRDALLAWTEATRRDLPWRRTRDPWSVLVSELMLQQTQVSRVVPRYLAFLERFPTAAACAAGSVGEVVTLWAGLGYNRRAVNLHRCAVAVVERHGGRLPADRLALEALPGIGPYTSRAVLAFAFEADAGVLDTNAARVLARLAGRSLGRREAQQRADELTPTGQSWAWNQAMLDLGALVCTARSPVCGSCPVRSWCEWRRTAADGGDRIDPAVGSAGVSGGQSPFAGSDRQGRGRLVDALRASGRVAAVDIAAAAGWPEDPARADRVARSLVRDGLALVEGADLVLP